MIFLAYITSGVLKGYLGKIHSIQSICFRSFNPIPAGGGVNLTPPVVFFT